MVHHPDDEMSGMPIHDSSSKEKLSAICRETGREALRARAREQVRTWPRDEGAVAVEMLFFLLVFVIAFFGSVEMAREISVKHALDVGTYRATRYLSIVPGDQATARAMIQGELDNNVLGGAGNVQMSVDMPSTAFQSVFSVTAEVAYQPAVPLMVFAPKTLRVIHSQSIEAYP